MKMKGKLTVVGSGPGGIDHITTAVQSAIEEAQTLVGYGKYIDLLENLSSGKEIISSAMTREKDRCLAAIDAARSGKKVVLVSGGDAGVYGLASLVLELLPEEERNEILVLPGVTSATACAALLGAPLIHDFAVISLSDLLTEKELIRKRLELAAEGDFVTVLYNPKSRRRTELFEALPSIFLRHRRENTPVGIVNNACRDGETVRICSLKDLLKDEDVHMGTTIVIGNSQTIRSGKKMITPRGYEISGKAEKRLPR